MFMLKRKAAEQLEDNHSKRAKVVNILACLLTVLCDVKDVAGIICQYAAHIRLEPLSTPPCQLLISKEYKCPQVLVHRNEVFTTLTSGLLACFELRTGKWLRETTPFPTHKKIMINQNIIYQLGQKHIFSYCIDDFKLLQKQMIPLDRNRWDTDAYYCQSAAVVEDAILLLPIFNRLDTYWNENLFKWNMRTNQVVRQSYGHYAVERINSDGCIMIRIRGLAGPIAYVNHDHTGAECSIHDDEDAGWSPKSQQEQVILHINGDYMRAMDPLHSRSYLQHGDQLIISFDTHVNSVDCVTGKVEAVHHRDSCVLQCVRWNKEKLRSELCCSRNNAIEWFE